MPALTDLTSHHPILSALAPCLSTLDLFSLAQTCRANYSVILASRPVFNVLRRACLCDGRGLKHRQNFTGRYSDRTSYVWGETRKIWQDEPIEVRLWGTTCDASNALPCRKCGVNVCEVGLLSPFIVSTFS
jgi:hypothetical protein